MRLSRKLIIIISAPVLILGWTFRLSLKEGTLNLFDDLPISPRYRAEHYDFAPSEFEASCFAGSNQTSKTPIPNIVHYVIGLFDPELSYPAYLSIRSSLQSIRPHTLKLHHTGNLNLANGFVQDLLRDPHVQPVQHSPRELAQRMSSTHYAHLADVLRLDVLLKDGGIYLDSDVFALQSFDALRRSPLDVVLGHEGGNRNGLCNAIIIARPNATFIRDWIASYEYFREGEWNDHSVLLPKKWADANPGQVCQLSPHAFFWPTWTRRHVRWMHEPLNQEQVYETEEILVENDGSLFDGQLAYHAWNQMSWELIFE